MKEAKTTLAASINASQNKSAVEIALGPGSNGAIILIRKLTTQPNSSKMITIIMAGKSRPMKQSSTNKHHMGGKENPISSVFYDPARSKRDSRSVGT